MRRKTWLVTATALLLAASARSSPPGQPASTGDPPQGAAGAARPQAPEGRAQRGEAERSQQLEAERSSSGRAAAQQSDSACAQTVALRVQQHYDAVRDLRARFVQTTQQVTLGSAGGGSLESRGEVVFAKPGRMRWSYDSPAPSLVVSDGKTLWIYDPAAHEVQQLPLGPDFLSGAAVQFLLGEGRLLEEFTVSARDCGAREVPLVLVPRRDSQYERLELRVDPKSGSVRETSVVDLLGNRTTIELSALRSNTRPDPGLFRFAPPAGTRVLSMPPAPPP